MQRVGTYPFRLGPSFVGSHALFPRKLGAHRSPGGDHGRGQSNRDLTEFCQLQQRLA